VPVDRKLLFLDPFPEDCPGPSSCDRQVGFAENLLLAASTLPRYQAIREDLDAINHRNRVLYRTQALRERVLKRNLDQANWHPMSRPEFCSTDVDSLIADRGAPFASYFYLRVFDLTDQLALLVTRLLGLADDSDEFRAVRHLVRAWRQNHYVPNLNLDDNDCHRETEFLVQYDLSYRERRAEFLLSSIDDEIYRLRAMIDWSEGPLEGTGRTVREEVQLLLPMRRGVRRGLKILRDTREELCCPRTAGVTVSARQRKLLEALKPLIGEDLRLGYIMAPVDEEACYLRARELLDSGRDAAISQVAQILEGLLAEAFRESRGAIKDALALDNQEPAQWSALLEASLDQFDYYDSLLYPSLASLDLGERDTVQTYRIGPADASHCRTAFQRLGESKLAGTALGAFGGFLREEWRANDIMWGRLDGAERLLHAILPGDDPAVGKDRRDLIGRAHRIIIDETFKPQDQEQFLRLLGVYLRRHADKLAREAPTGTKGKAPSFGEVLDWLKMTGEEHRGEVVAMLLQNALSSEKRIELFRRAYHLPDTPKIDETMDRLRRSSRIFGGMLQGLGSERRIAARTGAALGFLGPVAGWLIEVSIPGTRLGLWRPRLLAAMFAASGLLLAGGYLYWENDIESGWRWLALTLLFSSLLLFIEWLVLPHGRPGWRRWGIFGLLVFAAAGLIAVWQVGYVSPLPAVGVAGIGLLIGGIWVVRAIRRFWDNSEGERN